MARKVSTSKRQNRKPRKAKPPKAALPRGAKPRSAKKPARAQSILGLPQGREADINAFLQAALKADPSTRAGRDALRTAESAALRIARDLRRQAKGQRGRRRAELENRANESYFRAVLARQLPRLVELLRRPHIPPKQPVLPPVELELLPLSKPEIGTATPGLLSATVTWTQAATDDVSGFNITTHVGNPPQALPSPMFAVETAREATILGLDPSKSYRFSVTAVRLGLNAALSEPSDLTEPAISPLSATLPGGGAPLDLTLPAFSADPALLIDSKAEPLRAYVADAARIGQKWRYEHLKVQAIAAAREAMVYEEHIARLMGMAVDKLNTAEEMLNTTLIEAVKRQQDSLNVLSQATESAELDSLLDPLGDTAAQALLLPRFLAWLVETGPISFWIGLFEALICDLASVIPVFGGPTNFGRTRKYLKKVFDDPLSGIQAGLKEAATDILLRLDGEVEQMTAPLRAATDKVIEGTRQAMAEVFEGFDITLLMSPAKVAGEPDVPDVDPLEALNQQLSAEVNKLAEGVKDRVKQALAPLLDGSGSGLFETIVITFLCLPILAFLVISLAGGPFSAALLAAAVLLAAEELLRLLVQWLAGPLLKKIGELQQKLTELVGQLQSFFALQASLVQNLSPEEFLRILASQLRQLSDFLPQQFLEEAAGVLQEARNVVLRTATQLGLAAEQALGSENASAFEAISEDYATHLFPAPQLPGGTDPSRLAGAALLRDFARLEEQRTAIRDGKEIEFTHRLSLLRLLGGDPALSIQQLLTQRQVLVSLTERDLLDRMFPGVYRALIKDISATGILGTNIDPRLHGIPLSITHLGESRTRIKRSANPFAPPIELPDCFPDRPEDFAQTLLGPPFFDPPFPDFDDIVGGGLNAGRLFALRFKPFVDPLEVFIRRSFAVLKTTRREYAVRFLDAIFDEEILGDPFQHMCHPIRGMMYEMLPEQIGRHAVEISCGLVDPASLMAAVREHVDKLPFPESVLPLIFPPGSGSQADQPPDLRALADELAPILRNGFESNGLELPGLVEVAKQAWKEGRTAFLHRVGRWGDVDFEEDPDPQVRALGFVRLVRRAPSETMVYNLFPPAQPTSTRAEPATGVPDGSLFLPASALQYRPFENRGLEGDLLLRLESLDDDALLPLGPGFQIQQLSGKLTDIVLDITVRACYDPDLAQTVRASRSQTAAGFNVASQIAPAVPIGLPDSVVRVEAGASELRAVRYSLRAHRDKTLQVLTAAIARLTSPPQSLTDLVAGKSFLGRDAAFAPLGPTVTNFRLELSSASRVDDISSVSELPGLETTLRVSPTDLGFHPAVLAVPVVEQARLVSIGVAVIPMPEGVRTAEAELSEDPLDIQLQVTGLLGNVFPGFDPAPAPLPQRLRMTIPAETTNPPTLAELFAADAASALEFDLAGALSNGSRLYDVIVCLTFRAPTLRTRTVINALR